MGFPWDLAESSTESVISQYVPPGGRNPQPKLAGAVISRLPGAQQQCPLPCCSELKDGAVFISP